jgi:glycosyltransferase involved in cell wall biosynthesis
MNVLFLPDASGVNPYLGELADALERDGHDVSFSDRMVLPLLSGYYDADADPDVVHFHWLVKFVLSDSPVRTALGVTQFFFELAVLRAVSDVPVVWTVHNRHEHDQRWPTVERYVKRAFVRLFCDRLIVHCSAAADAIVEELGLPADARRRIEVVPHGNYVDAYENDVTEAQARQRLGLSADERVFLFIGSIRPYKRVPELIATFDEADVGDARLVVAGEPWNDEVEAQVERACADSDRVVTRLELVPEAEFQIYLNAADAVVLPFHPDVLTSGSVVLSMSFGTPVVVPRVGCLPETVPEDAGILYDPSDPDALRTALERAVDADLEAFGRRALAAIRELDWEAIGRRTATVYEAARSGDATGGSVSRGGASSGSSTSSESSTSTVTTSAASGDAEVADAGSDAEVADAGSDDQ